jgi:hypothetical protein
MSKFLPLILAFTLSGLTAIQAFAGEISQSDTGTYVQLGKDQLPTGLYYRLSQNNGKWLMEGKLPGGSWKDITCDSGCEYRKTTDTEVLSYFPPDWIANSNIACIQNIAQAFCRFSPKNEPNKAGYVIIALVTGKPIPMFIKRVPN